MNIWSDLIIEDMTDVDYVHGRRIFKGFEIENLGEHHDLYLKVIHYFWLMFLKMFEKCVQKFLN